MDAFTAVTITPVVFPR